MEGMDGIQRNVQALRNRLLAAAAGAADESGHLLTSYAKGIAPWTDRTTFLRNEISFDTETTSSAVRISVFHSREYGPWVEGGTRRSRPYPSLWPSVAANTDNVMSIFQRHMGEALGGAGTSRIYRTDAEGTVLTKSGEADRRFTTKRTGETRIRKR